MADEKLLTQEDVELFEKDEWIDGFNWKTLAGCLFVGLIMMPGAIYLGMVTGQSLAGAAEWVTIILFIEIAKRSFVKLRRQEIIMIYGMAAGMLMMGIRLGSGAQIFGGPLGNVIWDQFFVNSPQAKEFADMIPSWFAPPPGHPSYINRTFFDKVWAIPLFILGLHMVLSWTQNLAGGYLLYRIVNDIERLPFPMSRVHAGGATALAESSSKKETWRWRVFSIGAMIGLMFGAIYVTLPSITGALLPNAIMILPIPFIDFTAEINQFIPACALGISTTIGPLLAGFVLPFWAVVGGFIGAMGCWFILNPILYYNGLLPSWQKGMSVIPTSIALRVDYYISQGIGIALVICILGIIAIWKANLKSEYKKQDEYDPEDLKGRGSFPIWAAALIWFCCLASYVILCRILVPDFPLWIVILFSFVFTPLNSYLTARMIAMTGTGRGATFPFIKEGALLLSGYRGVAIWFAPLPLFNVGHGVDGFKQAELTRTKFISKVKGAIYGLVLLTGFSVFFWSIIWKMAPIPSGSYPYVQRMWPLFAQMQALWVKVLMERGGELTEFKNGNMNVKTGTVNSFESLIDNFPKSASAFMDDGKGHIWVGVVNKGLRIYDIKADRWLEVVPQVFIDKGFVEAALDGSTLTIPAKSIYTFAAGSDGRIYCGSDEGLLVMNSLGEKGLDWKLIKLNKTVGAPDKAKVRVDNIYLDRVGGKVNTIWFNAGSGMCALKPADIPFDSEKMTLGELPITYYDYKAMGGGKHVTQLLPGPDGSIICGTTKGVVAFKNNAWSKLTPKNYQEILCLTVDGKNIYAGTESGVLKISGGTAAPIAALDGMAVLAVKRLDKELYFLTAEDGYAIDSGNGNLTFTKELDITIGSGEDVQTMELNTLNSIDRFTADGKVMTYLSTGFGLLYYEGTVPKDVTLLSRQEGSLIETNTSHVMQDSTGSIWVMSKPVKSFLLRGINGPYILWSAFGGIMFYFLCVLFKLPLLFFYGAAGAAAGAVGAWPHTQIPLFTGALLGRFYFAKKFGAKKWKNYAPILLAGFACGMGLIGMSSIGISLIIKAVNALVY